MILYIYTKTNVPDAVISPLKEESNVRPIRFMLNLSKRGDIPMSMKWFVETHWATCADLHCHAYTGHERRRGLPGHT